MQLHQAHNADYYRGQLSNHLPRTQADKNSVAYWWSRLSSHLTQFEAEPSQATKANMILALNEYREAVSNGLEIDRTIPAPLGYAKTPSEWFRLQLNESMAMCRINPSEDRLKGMEQQLTSYLKAIAMGRIKP